MSNAIPPAEVAKDASTKIHAISSESDEKHVVGVIAEAKDATNPEPGVASVVFFNGIPNLLEGHVFADRFRIFERTGWDDTVGAVYFATPLADETKELVLRIDSNTRTDPTNMCIEVAVLKLAEAKNKFLLFSQIHSYDLTAPNPWLAVYNRGGPTVAQCLDASPGHRFTPGSAGRFAEHIVEILAFLHDNGFLATCLDFGNLVYDPCARVVFLSDLSLVRPDPSKRRLKSTTTPVVWRGGPQYAPLSYHGRAPLTQWDEVEVVFYLFYEMVNGKLPWSGKHASEIETTKVLFSKEDHFAGMPKEYPKLFNQILYLKREHKTDYSEVQATLQEIYTKIGGVKSAEDNHDFEIDFPEIPEEQLPRFVLEKIPIDGTETKNEEEEAKKNNDAKTTTA